MLTVEQTTKIQQFVESHTLAKGLGSEASPCSIAAINLALTGELTDEIPDCMSLVIGRWVINIQDAMPDTMRNSAEWKILLPQAAGTGREREEERRKLVLSWMWGTVLPQVQHIADSKGFGEEWRMMCKLQTEASARKAATAAYYNATAATYAAAATYATAATYAAAAANAAANAAATYYTTVAADYTATAAANATRLPNFWEATSPPALLARLIAVSA